MSSNNHFFSGPSPRLFAHRGASAIAPENTIEAFRIAKEHGVSYLELDIHVSADGQLVVLHDPSVSRTTGRRGRVENMLYGEIRTLDAGFTFTLDHGRTFPFRGRGVTIPTLDTVLETFPEMRLTVEIKRTRNKVCEILRERLRQHGAEERVVVASHEHDTLARFRQLSPGVATGFSKNEVREFLGRLRAGELAGYRPPGMAFQVPEYKGLRRVVSRRVIEAIHRFGVEVHVWTVNEPIHIARLLDWGVDGIMTDDPVRALQNVAALSGLGNGPGGSVHAT
ncbi:MAG TPA: glycerophosphodiester phosphodiesterase [Vicinamibacteria bacterium]|nr:glycerophosphodiester phosphodiesterase [Vicinamibacteria bacterium]